MQNRWVWPVLLAALLAVLIPPALAVEPAGYGHVFPAPDPSDPVDVPAPSPAAPPKSVTARIFPAAADPQPTFAPLENSPTVYVMARDSTLPPPSVTPTETVNETSNVTPNGTPGAPQVFVCDGSGDEVEINAALIAAQGGVVELLDGNFRCAGRITLQPHTTLRGQGSGKTTIEIVAKPGTTGYLPVAVCAEYVNIGGFTMRGHAFLMVTRSHVRVRDVSATCVDLGGTWRTASGNGMFFVWVAPPVNVVDDVEFYQCSVVNAHTHGFNMNQDYRDGVERTISNVRFLECRAVGCGYGVAGDPGVPATVTSTNQSRSEWITGFDLHEWQDLVNCEVINCVASDNWESGFHLEPGARYGSNGKNIGPRTVSQNIVFRNCVSTNNGQRNTYADHFFMSGYYLSRDTRLEDCLSFNNRNCGYYVHAGDGSSFSGCTDVGSTYGWKVCKASSDIAITDCTSTSNSRWALWLAFSRRLTVDGFRHTGVASDRGYQSILGWYKDEPEYQQPVTDSSFEITACGNGMPIINQDGSGNTYALAREGTASGGPVTADFTATQAQGAAPLSVRFTDRSSNANHWWWNFGDGATSYEPSPVHAYAAPGNYTVTLMAADDLQHDAETRTDLVSVTGPVTVSFAASPTAIPVGGQVRFTSAVGGNPYTYAWTFGDGGTSTAPNPVHVYTRAGTYPVSLTAMNPQYAGTKTLPGLVTVYDPILVSFVMNQTAGTVPVTVAFADTSTGGPTSWRWDFGDGTTSTERNPAHTYASPGTYSVTLTASNGPVSNTTTARDAVSASVPPPVIGQALRTVPGAAMPPTDTDGDGCCDDVNGNGRTDFADVVLYFNQMSWIAANEPLVAFDYNGNGRIDFADVIWLFNTM